MNKAKKRALRQIEKVHKTITDEWPDEHQRPPSRSPDRPPVDSPPLNRNYFDPTPLRELEHMVSEAEDDRGKDSFKSFSAERMATDEFAITHEYLSGASDIDIRSICLMVGMPWNSLENTLIVDGLHVDAREALVGWGFRIYQTQYDIRNVFMRSLGRKKEGHPFYANETTTGKLDTFYFLDCGGNNQHVCRSEATEKHGVENLPPKGGLIEVSNGLMENCGHGNGRGSFPYQWMHCGRRGAEVDIYAHHIAAYTHWDVPKVEGGQTKYAHGCFLVEGEASDYWEYGEVTLEAFDFRVFGSDRAAIIFKNTRRGLIQNGRLISEEGHPYCDIDRLHWEVDYTTKSCGHVEWLGSTMESNMTLRLRGEVIGPCAGTDYYFEDGKRVG